MIFFNLGHSDTRGNAGDTENETEQGRVSKPGGETPFFTDKNSSSHFSLAYQVRLYVDAAAGWCGGRGSVW